MEARYFNDPFYGEIREMARKFSNQEIAPLAAEIDKKKEIPQSVIEKLGENGFLGIFVPETLGGSGLDYVSYAIIVEEISRACASTGVFVSAHNSLGIYPILCYGSEEQKKKFLPH